MTSRSLSFKDLIVSTKNEKETDVNRHSNRTQKAAWAALATAAALCLALAPAASALDVADVRAGSGGLDFVPRVENGGFVLTVSGPDGYHHRAEFGPGESPGFSIFEQGGGVLPDGVYNYELTAVPSETQRRDAFEANQLQKRSGGVEARTQSGAFSIVGGAVVAGGEEEPGQSPAGAGPVLAPKDFVINDDLIVTLSACVGNDCVNGESFGFDTLRLKENNTRIRFFDTSVGSFPTVDWEIQANDSANGGQSWLRVNDLDNARSPFTIEANTPSHTLYVDSAKRIGIGTSTPVVQLHVKDGNTPALRLEQDNSSGFTAQTWDVAGNESNFFVRSATTGSQLPFRIRPGAPTSSIDISASGNVGIGTTSPDAHFEVEDTGDTDFRLTKILSSGDLETQFRATVTTNNAFFGTSTNDVMALTVNAIERMRITTGGNIGMGCQNPGSDLVVGSASDCSTAPASSMNAGDSTFTVTSSRTLKKDLSPVQVPDILEKIGEVGVYEYDFINGPEDKMGLMAEDFHRIFGRGSDKLLNGQEVQMALWIAVQELARRNEELSSQNDLLKDEVERIKKRLN